MIRWVLALIASPAIGQSAAPMSAAACLQSYAAIVELSQYQVTREEPVQLGSDGWCVARDVAVQVIETGSLRIAQLFWRIDDHQRLSLNRPPTALSLKADGISYVPHFGDPVQDYLLELQFGQGKMRAALDATWAQDGQAVSLNEASMHFASDNWFNFSGVFKDTDFTNLQRLVCASATEMTLEVEMNGLFETYLAVPIGTVLLDGAEDPQAEIVRYKGLAVDFLATLPAEIFDRPTLSTIEELIDDLPRPAGRVRVEMQSADGIGPGSFYGDLSLDGGMADFWQGLGAVSVDVTYEPADP